MDSTGPHTTELWGLSVRRLHVCESDDIMSARICRRACVHACACACARLYIRL